MMTFIYAQDQAGGIGVDNRLPWSMPADLQHFKRETMGQTIVMGRKTFESLGSRLLPGRQSVVITRDLNYRKDLKDLIVLNDLKAVEALAMDQDIMVIGGANLFEALWDKPDVILRTVIDETFPADTWMPEIDTSQYECVQIKNGIVDEKNPHPHHFERWERIRKEI